MPDRYQMEAGSRGAANDLRDQYSEHLAGDPDRRTKTVAFEADTPDHVVERATGRAALAREEQTTGFQGLELSPSEKANIDFTKVSPVEARQAKAKAAEKGVGDFLGFYDPTLTVEENEAMFERAARESSGGRDATRSTQERHAEAFKRSESEMLEHAREGVKHGSQQAERELRRRGVSESEIQRLKRSPAGRLRPTTELLFPDVGTVTPNEWATVKRSHEHRRVEAQHADEGKRAQQLTNDPEQWRDAPGEYDYPGVDTPAPAAEWLDDDQVDEFSDLTRDLWTWQD